MKRKRWSSDEKAGIVMEWMITRIGTSCLLRQNRHQLDPGRAFLLPQTWRSGERTRFGPCTANVAEPLIEVFIWPDNPTQLGCMAEG